MSGSSNTINWKVCLPFVELLLHFCQRSIGLTCVYLSPDCPRHRCHSHGYFPASQLPMKGCPQAFLLLEKSEKGLVYNGANPTAQGLRDLLPLLHCLPVHGCCMLLHLFTSFFISFFSFLYFSVYQFCMCFVRFIPKTLFPVNIGVYISLPIFRNRIDFCIYIVSWGLTGFTYSRTFFFSFLVEYLGFSV